MKPSDTWRVEPFYAGDDAETATEIAEKKGISVPTVRAYAKKMVSAGVWTAVRVKREGKRNPEDAYIVKAVKRKP